MLARRLCNAPVAADEFRCTSLFTWPKQRADALAAASRRSCCWPTVELTPTLGGAVPLAGAYLEAVRPVVFVGARARWRGRVERVAEGSTSRPGRVRTLSFAWRSGRDAGWCRVTVTRGPARRARRLLETAPGSRRGPGSDPAAFALVGHSRARGLIMRRASTALSLRRTRVGRSLVPPRFGGGCPVDGERPISWRALEQSGRCRRCEPPKSGRRYSW